MKLGTGSVGEKLLRQWGWREGKGIGKHEDGVSTYIRVKKKDDTLGLGAVPANAVVAGAWWERVYDYSAKSSAEASGEPDAGSERRSLAHTLRSALHQDAQPALDLHTVCGGASFGKFTAHHRPEGKLNRIRLQEERHKAARAAQRTADAQRSAAVPEPSSPDCAPSAEVAAIEPPISTAHDDSDERRRKKRRKGRTREMLGSLPLAPQQPDKADEPSEPPLAKRRRKRPAAETA